MLLDQKDKKIVAATLLLIMGKECLYVCRNLPMTEEERQDTDAILTKLDEYFVPKQNTIYEWYVFNCRSQKPGESFDQFLTELCKFTATCQFSAFEDEILRDRIVTGLRGHGRLLQETTLTLQKAIDICGTNEMAGSQRLKMEQTDTVHLVHGNETCAHRTDPGKNPRKIKNCTKQSNEKPKKKSKDERQRVNQLSENGALGEPDSNKSIYSLQSP